MVWGNMNVTCSCQLPRARRESEASEMASDAAGGAASGTAAEGSGDSGSDSAGSDDSGTSVASEEGLEEGAEIHDVDLAQRDRHVA